ncbi:MAG: tail fiber domain-containing protein [Deltaproteobacteria bacterium]|nr:tail fiber domain-containing protein [Deltaproteobacteria bacterium]
MEGVTFLSSVGTGVDLPAGGSAWNSLSDRNAKTDFVAVDARQVLARVAALPMSTWRYKEEVSRARHMGPMAQDFRAAFGLGDSDKHISTIDADGVALAAVQGLNLKVEDETRALRAEAATLQSENAALKVRLERVEALVARGAQGRPAGERRSDLGFGLLGLGMLAVGGGVVVARRRRAS